MAQQQQVPRHCMALHGIARLCKQQVSTYIATGKLEVVCNCLYFNSKVLNLTHNLFNTNSPTHVNSPHHVLGSGALRRQFSKPLACDWRTPMTCFGQTTRSLVDRWFIPLFHIISRVSITCSTQGGAGFRNHPQ